MRYTDGTWQRVGDHTLTLRTDGPTVTSSGSVGLEVSMPIELHVQFYDLAGPFITLEPNVHAELGAEGVHAFWGLESRAAARSTCSAQATTPGSSALRARCSS